MDENPLQGWLAEATDDAIVICPDDIDTEAQGNLRCYSLSHDQAATVGLTEVVKFVHSIVAARGRWLPDASRVELRGLSRETKAGKAEVCRAGFQQAKHAPET